MATSGDPGIVEQRVELADLSIAISRHLTLLGRQRPDRTQLEGLVMRFIDHHPGVTPGFVAQALKLRSSNLSALLRSLETAGLVRSERDAADRRSSRLYITEQALANVREIKKAWADDLEGLNVSVEDLATTLRVLAVAAQHLEGGGLLGK